MSEEANEKTKRSKIKESVLKKLFLLSGNRCAMPDCKQLLVDENGTVLCEICHIEAAEKGGPRFNPFMTNAQRADFQNLMLLCPTCHTKVDKMPGQTFYTVEKLQEIKNNHERKFAQAFFDMKKRFVDLTESQSFVPAKNAKKNCRILGWKLNDYELQETLKDINAVGEKLKTLPDGARSLFSVMIKRGSITYGGKFEVSMKEVELVTGKTSDEIIPNLDVLEKYGFVLNVDANGNYGLPVAYLCSSVENGLDGCWKCFWDFSDKTAIDLNVVLVDLNFSVFDE